MGEIYTVGHSSLTLERFLGLLSRWGIELVADVRRFPTSKKYPHFRREELARALAEAGIGYVFLGEELGGYRKGGYEAYMRTEGFQRGLRRLIGLARERRVAVMCAERDPRGCHRRYIAAALAARGFRVVHILGEGKARVEEARLL
ncbi:MAG: DUF488 domain-containing protein [Caldiserica bacterium]|nr:DUF488 domain-containing protein [Caldisericota bacterium]